jgi:hypothetical protein
LDGLEGEPALPVGPACPTEEKVRFRIIWHVACLICLEGVLGVPRSVAACAATAARTAWPGITCRKCV